MGNGEVTNLNKAREQKKSKQLTLANEEKQLLQNLQLKRQILDLQYQKENLVLQNDLNMAVANVSKRLGEDISQYKADLDTGILTKIEPSELPVN